MLEINTIAPDFSLPNQRNEICTLKEQRGKWTVVYFYPKNDTPGCTKEACAISEIYNDFTKLGVTVLGVSKDSPASHAKFATKYQLPFTLLSDESTDMMQAYEAWQEKSMYGKKYLGTVRVTYIISPEGKIVKAYSKVTPADHALELLDDIKTLI